MGGGDSNSKIFWISWIKYSIQKKNGGLGVIGLRDSNPALLGKWLRILKIDLGKTNIISS